MGLAMGLCDSRHRGSVGFVWFMILSPPHNIVFLEVQNSMKMRRYYLISILSVMFALGFHFMARDLMQAGLRLKATNLKTAVKRHEQATPDPVATRLSNRGRVLGTATRSDQSPFSRFAIAS